MSKPKAGDTVLYGIKTASGLKTKKGEVTKVKGGKISLNTAASLDTSDQVDSEDDIKMHHDFVVMENVSNSNSVDAAVSTILSEQSDDDPEGVVTLINAADSNAEELLQSLDSIKDRVESIEDEELKSRLSSYVDSLRKDLLDWKQRLLDTTKEAREFYED